MMTVTCIRQARMTYQTQVAALNQRVQIELQPTAFANSLPQDSFNFHPLLRIHCCLSLTLAPFS